MFTKVKIDFTVDVTIMKITWWLHIGKSTSIINV